VSDPSEDPVLEHASPYARGAYLALGWLCVVVGLVGALLPILPTAPFMILAAACFARGSQRFYGWIIRHPSFGPAILEWRVHRSIAWRTKLTAIALMSTSLACSIVLFVHDPYLRGLLAALGLALAVWLYRIPSRDRVSKPRRQRP